MKKTIFLMMSLLFAIVMAGLCGCNGCKGEGPKGGEPEDVYHDYDGVIQDFTPGVLQIQALHRQTMYQKLGVRVYAWLNSMVIFNDTVSYDNIDSLHITDVNDVFFYWDDTKGPLVQYVNSNVKNGIQIPWPISGVWIEDGNMSDKQIKLGAEDVLQRLKEWNGILPGGCNALVLRLPLGPKACNPQWVIGGVGNPLFIDAVTGEISDRNPAFF